MISIISIDAAIVYEDTERICSPLEICREMRKMYPPLGLVFLLSSIVDDATRLLAYQAGVDDCLSIFTPKAEVEARIAVLLKRCSIARARRITYGPVAIDLIEQTVTVDGHPVKLTPIQFRLLNHMLLNRGRLIDSKEFKQLVFRSSEKANGAKLRVHIFELRQKLGGQKNLILSVKGKGYGVGLNI
jgi:two-component system response regulator QseB